MANFFLKFNRTYAPINEKYNFSCDDLKAVPFSKACDLFAKNEDECYTIKAIYTVHNETYGEQLIAVCECSGDSDFMFRLGMPRHFVEEIDPNNEEVISAVNSGNVVFKITKYYSKKWKKEIFNLEFI